jgi:hypothetical protein
MREKSRRLDFLDREGVGFTDLDARFTAQALFLIHGNGLSVLKFIDLNRANIDALAVARTLVDINSNLPTHFLPPV